MQVSIAALALDSSGMLPARTCMPHFDKVAGEAGCSSDARQLGSRGHQTPAI